MKKNKLLLIISALLSVAALVLLLISIFGDFETNWVLSAGLFCVLLGNICILIAQRKKKQD